MLLELERVMPAVERSNVSEASVYGAQRGALRELRPAVPGAAFACPVCGGRFRVFHPFGTGRRRNAMCPGCGSLERHRFLWLYLRRHYSLAGRRCQLLHVAPEPCIRAALLRDPALSYVSVDLFDPQADRSADLTALPFASAGFNFAICSHVLEHVERDRDAMRELHRVLRPGGRAIVMVPIDMKRPQTYEDPSIDTAAGRNAAFGHPYHVRICGADYPDRLREAGFEVATEYSRAMLPPHQRRFWRINKTVLFDCRRPR